MPYPALAGLLGGLGAGSAAGGGAAAGGGGISGIMSLLAGGGGGGGGQAMGGGNFWDAFKGKFMGGGGGISEESLMRNERGRMQSAGIDRFAETMRPRGDIQVLGPQYSGAAAGPNLQGSTALQSLFQSIASRRGGGMF